jgi:hypothetical protein
MNDCIDEDGFNWCEYETDAGFYNSYDDAYGDYNSSSSGFGDFASGLGGLLGGALSLTGDFYNAKNQLELQKLQAERERVSYNQQLPVYSNSSNSNLIYVGLGIVAVIGLVAIIKK